MALEFLKSHPGFTDEDIDCYIHVFTTMQTIGGKWKMLILWHVHDSGVRYNELRRLIPGVSQKMLTQHLRELELDGLIERKVYPEMPPRVEYAMTEYGRTLEPVFDIMYDWGVNHKARQANEN
jgi:DNA-binding HxlR family transcriptional regulator